MLFKQTTRTDESPKSCAESTYAHLDRSCRPEYERIRTLIEDWCARVPSLERNEFIQRITSGDDLAFHSTLLELYTHELLLSTGHDVRFHPEPPDTTRRPDFLAVAQDGSQTVVECTVATEDSDGERAAQARLNTLYNSINGVSSPDVFLDLRIAGTPNSCVPGSRWRKQIQDWVNALDYEALLRMGPIPNDDKLARLELDHDGLSVTIKPIPKKRSARGKPGRPIGLQSFEGCMVTSHNQIRETVRDKASRYGAMQCPYVVVVNCLGEHADEEEIHGAMFGYSGLWSNPTRAAHTRVSAVLAIQHLLPWSIAVAEARLFHNPNAKFPYVGALASFPQTTYNSETDGIHARIAMRVDAAWPHLSTAAEQIAQPERRLGLQSEIQRRWPPPG